MHHLEAAPAHELPECGRGEAVAVRKAEQVVLREPSSHEGAEWSVQQWAQCGIAGSVRNAERQQATGCKTPPRSSNGARWVNELIETVPDRDGVGALLAKGFQRPVMHVESKRARERIGVCVDVNACALPAGGVRLAQTMQRVSSYVGVIDCDTLCWGLHHNAKAVPLGLRVA